jgi:ubiquinone/menaquinone biosynthesis C-methylase UbiE
MSAMVSGEDGTGGVEAFKAFEAAGWGARARTYERLTGRVTARVIRPLLDAAAVGPSVRVLDLGTGTGGIAAAAAARGATPVGVDLAEGMVAAARARYPGIDFRRADAEALPFDDGAFDAVVAGFVFNHLPRPQRAAAESARVLSRGGRLSVAVWDEPRRARFCGVLVDAMAAAGVAARSLLPAGPDPYRFAADTEMRALLVDAGFTEVVVEAVELAALVADVDELIEGLLGGTVRTASALAGASEEERGRVRAALETIVAPYRHDGGLALPVVVKLAAGRKP